MNDPKAAAANDHETQVVDATATTAPTVAIAPPPTDTLEAISAVQILLLVAAAGGSLPEAQIKIERAKVLDESRTDAALESCVTKGALFATLSGGGRSFELTATGWALSLAAVTERHKQEQTKKDVELRAFRRRLEDEHSLSHDVEMAALAVESCKQSLAAAKEDHNDALTKLAIYVKGDVQPTLFDIKPDAEPTGELGAFERGASAQAQGRKCEAPDGMEEDDAKAWRRGWRFSLMNGVKEQRDLSKLPGLTPAALADALVAAIPEGQDPPKVEAVKSDALGAPHLVADALAAHQGKDRYLLLPLYEREEWATLHSATYGNAVVGRDQDDGAKARRQTGGEHCGRIVAVGRKKLAIGPMSDAVVVVVSVPV
jgi:hypothetical protein